MSDICPLTLFDAFDLGGSSTFADEPTQACKFSTAQFVRQWVRARECGARLTLLHVVDSSAASLNESHAASIRCAAFAHRARRICAEVRYAAQRWIRTACRSPLDLVRGAPLRLRRQFSNPNLHQVRPLIAPISIRKTVENDHRCDVEPFMSCPDDERN